MPRSSRYAVALIVLLGCAGPATPVPAPVPTGTPAAAPDTSAPPTIDPRAFEAYVGQYADAPDADMVLSIYGDSGRYYLHPTDNPRFELTPAGVDTFAALSIQHRIAFVRDSSGRVTALRMRARTRDFPPTPRISERPIIVRFVEMTRTDTMIPMRDGTRLHTVILAPAGSS
ncbi:MAG TPA: DUF3471 domain-containing protein, partial [Gemmatimonadaceae bacterium]|nr:DUF3471 domain-containing protein [Gemmatimonadaceae bacterium]